MTSKRAARRETADSVKTGVASRALASAVAELVGAEDLATLQAALPRVVAHLLDADVVLVVAREGDRLQVMATHGTPPARGVVDPERDAAALAIELGKPICFDPAPGPPRVDSALAMPLPVSTRGKVAVSCHRPDPFDAEARETLDALLVGVALRWTALVRECEGEAAALQARLRQQERKLRELAERLERNDKLKAEFVATMSHELRTPLNVVLGFSSLLADQAFGELNREQDEACQKILESSERLAGLINDLLDVSRLEAGTLHFTFAPLDLTRFLSECVEEMRPIAEQREISLELDVPAGTHEIEADEGRLHQVIAHLLDNALKFTEPGGRVGVRLLDPSEEGGVAIEVWDTGIGIPSNAMHRLFERFYQVDSSNTRLYGGTGLGLALVKEFTERHGGRVEVESRVGHGSTFRLELPRAASQMVADLVF